MTVLAVDDVSVSFGGVHAVDGVSLRVDEGEIVGLIGPNGAGKTTLMDCISGHRRADTGRIALFDRDVTREPAAFRTWLGLGRSFQDCRLFPTLTVFETLVVHQERHQPSALFGSLVAWPSTRKKLAAKGDAADAIIERMGLSKWRDVPVGELSTGTRRVCDLACVMLSRPRVLLLDEPAAGIAQKETEALGPLIRYVRDDLECSILLIEHDMPTIFSLSDRVVALESGRVLVEGAPEDVRTDPRVVASYLGTTDAVIQRSGNGSTR